MNNNRNYSSRNSMYLQKKINKLILLLFFLITFVCGTYAQTNVDTVKDNWETRWGVIMELDWNDNVYKLSDSQQNRMNLNNPGDDVSGRFKDLENISDVILSIAPELEVRTKDGLFGRSLSLSGIIDYQHYISNTKKSHVNLGLSIRQKISKKGKIIFQADYTPSYFKKNYLLDAIDSTGSVSSSERIYYEGVYNELEFLLSYKHLFNKWIIDVESDLFVGYRSRNYNSQFPGRSQDAFGGGLALEIVPAKWWYINLGYYFESVQSPITKEVMILDEPDYQIDFNNDRDFADNNRRTEQTVNRSNYSNTFELGLTFKPLKRLGLHAGFELLFKDYISQESIDPNFKDRNDTRSKIRLGCDYQILKKLFLTLEYKNVTQQTDRPEDPESVGEETDYITNIVKAGVQWQF